MAFTSVTSLFASVIGVTPDEFTDLRKAWQVAVENGSPETFLAFLCRERGLAEDVFLQRLAAATLGGLVAAVAVGEGRFQAFRLALSERVGFAFAAPHVRIAAGAAPAGPARSTIASTAPVSGHNASPSLNRTAFFATLHCLTGCAIGEVLGLVIASAAGGNPELVYPGETGLLVPPLDPAAWTRALDRMLGDDEFRARVARAGRTLAREEFTMPRTAERTEIVYREAIERRRLLAGERSR